MAELVTRLSARRRWSALLTLLAGGALAVGFAARSFSLIDTAYLSGWILFGTVLFLTAYNARKKLPYPPLVKASAWMQWHIWIGWLSLLLFGIHTGFRIPGGVVESTLAVLFLLVAGSGVAGLVLSRTLPARLTIRGEEVLFERIPTLRHQLRQRAEEMVEKVAGDSRNPVLVDLYRDRLADYFAGPRNFWGHMMQSRRPLRRILHEIEVIERYLNDEDKVAAAEMVDLIRHKDGLDFHHANQAVLKGWLFVHVPLVFALLVFASVHMVLVHLFRGNGP